MSVGTRQRKELVELWLAAHLNYSDAAVSTVGITGNTGLVTEIP